MHFVFAPFPNLAQMSPVFGMSVSDLDADGKVDLLLAQNFYSPQRETGRMSGGLGVLLKGNEQGGFTALWPAESGVVIPEDGKSLVLANYNGDERPDFLVGVNDGLLQRWDHQGVDDEFFHVRLGGNTSLHGNALITLHYDSGQKRVKECHTGSGYLSQEPAMVFAKRDGLRSVSVRWADGSVTELEIEPEDHVVVIFP